MLRKNLNSQLLPLNAHRYIRGFTQTEIVITEVSCVVMWSTIQEASYNADFSSPLIFPPY